MAPCFGFISRIIKSNKHTKIIAIADNIIPHEKRFFDNWLTKYFVKCVDCWIAMSKSVLDDINIFDKAVPKKLMPHPLFDNFGQAIEKAEAQKRLNLDSQKINLLFFGLVREYKGLDLLLEALSDERLKQMPLHLTVAGEFYDNYKKYEDLVEQLGLKERVSMQNKFVEDNEVVNYFCSTDLVVLPYKSATQSGVTQIAFHFSKPMLVTCVGGLPEIVADGKSGYVCLPDAKSIADCLIDFCTNRKDFSESLEEEKQRFAWDKMTAAIRLLYNESKIYNSK
jgi:glycosyltransferase involved in cell wall biosynthesis